MYLVPDNDPERVRAVREKIGLTDEDIEQAKKDFDASLERFYKKHPEKRPIKA